MKHFFFVKIILLRGKEKLLKIAITGDAKPI